MLPETTVLDPVCGMQVDPATAPAQTTYQGTTYYFCCSHCLTKFQSDPERYLSGKQEPMTLGMQSVTPAPPGTKRQYICPMDPEVVSDQPGPCPKCGMALEPKDIPSEDTPDPEHARLKRHFWIALIATVPIVLLSMGGMLLHTVLDNPTLRDLFQALPTPVTRFVVEFLLDPETNGLLQAILASFVVGYSGGLLYQRAWAALRQGNLNMFTLIVIGVSTAYVYSLLAIFWPDLFPSSMRHHGRVEPYFESAAVIIVLVLLGQVLEGRARHATTAAIRKLAGMAPKSARLVLPDGKEQDLPLELIRPGDIVRIRPGEKIPVDGVVTDGESTTQEAMLSGEPMPVEKSIGSKVWAATLNTTGTLLVRTEKVAADTLLAQIIRHVAEAQRSRAPIQSLVDRVSAVFVPLVLVTSLLTLIGWLIWGGEQAFTHGLLNAIAVLMIACPCALGLATPMAITVGIGRGAEVGILVKSAEALELLHRADCLVFDKTGTLTEGKPKLVSVEAVPSTSVASSVSEAGMNDTRSREWLQLAASLEQGSEHPLAVALVRAARERSLPLQSVQGFRAVPGQGVTGKVAGHRLVLGNPAFFIAVGIPCNGIEDRVKTLRQQGQTVLLLAVDGRLTALFGVADPLKSTSAEAVRQLQGEGITLFMVTGDSAATAEFIARQAGISKVFAERLPQEKQKLIKELQGQGKLVAMAGDGINDAPALAQADVGIALGTGTDIAMESAALTLVHGDLRTIAQARALSRATIDTIMQNLLLAFAYNVLAIPLAASGLLDPILASAAMTLSSLSVVGNSLRLRRRVLQ